MAGASGGCGALVVAAGAAERIGESELNELHNGQPTFDQAAHSITHLPTNSSTTNLMIGIRITLLRSTVTPFGSRRIPITRRLTLENGRATLLSVGTVKQASAYVSATVLLAVGLLSARYDASLTFRIFCLFLASVLLVVPLIWLWQSRKRNLWALVLMIVVGLQECVAAGEFFKVLAQAVRT